VPLPVYSTRFAATSGVTSAASVELVAPASGKVAVVRSLTAYCGTGAGQCFFVLRGVATLKRVDVAAAASISADGLRWVFESGDHLDFTVGSGTWAVSVHGYLLDA
jgi:hypothetical protein